MKKVVKYLLLLLLFLTPLLLIVNLPPNQSELKIYFFDVGQGDAILIRTPTQQNIVVDGGPDNTLINKLGEVLPFYDRTIDLMILTHPHDDHLFGLIEVLKRYQVDQVLYSGQDYPAAGYLEWLRIIKDRKVFLQTARVGQQYNFGQVQLKVLYPLTDYSGQLLENSHEANIVVQVIYQDFKLLLSGDLEEEGENEIFKFQSSQSTVCLVGQACLKIEDQLKQLSLKSQVLKIGHHGSKTSSSEEFLQQISPKYVIISVGADNKFGHPAFSTLFKLKRIGTIIYRTDEHGDIILLTDGHELLLTLQRS